MPTLHIGSRSSEELIPKVKGCTFIVMGDCYKLVMPFLVKAVKNDSFPLPMTAGSENPDFL